MKKGYQTLKGFRDFLPEEKNRRDFVLGKIIETFQSFGFESLETPTLEYADLLLGKYGDEADKLVYTFEDRGERRIGLRYDQTVPTARVLAQYQNELPRYFRRYQVQSVFRADKPQKGRFREFTQCDIDIFGSTQPIADAEIIACTYFAYANIGFASVIISFNDRQTLISTLTPFTTETVDVFSLIQSIDKLDKMTSDQVREELVSKGLAADQAQAALDAIEKADMTDNLQKIVDISTSLGVPPEALEFNPKLARGLDYYTGTIFEVLLPEYGVGSVAGGGRYDNLINDLSGVQMPAVGIAFGFDRTVEAALEMGLIPALKTQTEVLITLFDEKTLPQSLSVAQELRAADIRVEVYPALDKLGKQFKLADQKGIPFVVIVGEEEAEAGQISVKNMQTGEQQTQSIDEFLSLLRAD